VAGEEVKEEEEEVEEEEEERKEEREEDSIITEDRCTREYNPSRTFWERNDSIEPRRFGTGIGVAYDVVWEVAQCGERERN